MLIPMLMQEDKRVGIVVVIKIKIGCYQECLFETTNIFGLEKYCSLHCILASNTSTINLKLIGDKSKSHDRIIGAQFFSPAHIMPLLEIVRTAKTSHQVVVDLLGVGKKIRKTPIVVGNCMGFVVNRMFFSYTQSALLLVERGADIYRIDRAITKFGMPIGPFRLCDVVGFGVAIATGSHFVQNFPERTYKSMLIPMLMQEDKRIGQEPSSCCCINRARPYKFAISVIFWRISTGSHGLQGASRSDNR